MEEDDITDNLLANVNDDKLFSILINDTEANKAAWIDDDNEEEASALSAQFQDIHGKTPKWAECKPSQEASVIEVKKLLSDRIPESLRPSVISFKEILGFSSPKYKGNVSHFTFNIEHPLALVSYRAKGKGYCSLFQVDGEHNYEIQTFSFDKFPVTFAAFIDLKRFVVVSDSCSSFYVYNMENGNKKRFFSQEKMRASAKLKKVVISPNKEKLVILSDTNLIHIYNADAITHVSTLLLPYTVKDAAFHFASGQLFVYCGNGFVYIYDVEKLLCVHKFYDDGCVEGMCIAVAPNSKYIACGSNSGIVNLYDTSKLQTESPPPNKTFKKILTKITSLSFNSTSEILFMSSSATLGAAKMAHVNSLQVFKNYPNANVSPRPIMGAEFSPRSAYLAVVKPNKVELLRLKHYSSY